MPLSFSDCCGIVPYKIYIDCTLTLLRVDFCLRVLIMSKKSCVCSDEEPVDKV